LKLCWDKPRFGGCREIYDLRFTIYDLKCDSSIQIISLAAAGGSAGAGAVFLVGERVRQKLLTQFIEARLLASLTVGLSPARRKSGLRFCIWRWHFDRRHRAAAIRF
jgi:hypothetical protein